MSELMIKSASEFKTVPVSWLWPGRVPKGKVTLLAGDPGLGKSFVTIDIAARLTRSGGPKGDWPDGPSPVTEPADVVFLSAEDDPADTIRPRLEASGADLDRVHIIEGIDLPQHRNLGHVELDRDIQAVSRLMGKLTNPRLLVIDPISAYMGEADSNNNAEVRAVLADLARMAMATGVAVIAVTHLNKSNASGQKIVYRAMGSLAFTAAARMVWYVSRFGKDAHVRAMTPVKNNLGSPALGLTFRVESGEGDKPGAAFVNWLSTDLAQCADEVENVLEPDSDGGDRAVREAAEFLRAALENGPQPAGRVIARAQEAGISLASLKRARKLACVDSGRAPGTDPSRPWMWAVREQDRTFAPLPEDAPNRHHEPPPVRVGIEPVAGGFAQPLTPLAELQPQNVQPAKLKPFNAAQGSRGSRLRVRV